MTLVDTNVLIDIVTSDAEWFDWSAANLRLARAAGPLFINDIIYAELGVRYDSRRDLDDFLNGTGLERSPMSNHALYLASQAFRLYRSRGGRKTNVLADFFIGAQASTLDLPILTRDVARYRAYFPTVHLIAPRT